jgi:hypothetical protein
MEMTRVASSADPERSTPANSSAANGRDTKAVSTEKSTHGNDSKPIRIREGSKLVDQIGEFQRSGDQINFFSKEAQGALRVLENLALERIARVLDDNPSKHVWSVTGVITEFRGENYLLVTRAALKAQPKVAPAVEQRKPESPDKKAD